MFELIHGSAPDIAHLGIANPIAAIWHLGEGHAAAEVMSAVESVTARALGTIAGKDRIETILQAVLAALS